MNSPRKSGKLFQHTAARRRLAELTLFTGANAVVSTHSRPKAAGRAARPPRCGRSCFNTQPPEGGWTRADAGRLNCQKFQHTAARRRLAYQRVH